ncbi:MAG: hypothetical protein ACXWZB_04190, partial [Gaiellaceae bacterium]
FVAGLAGVFLAALAAGNALDLKDRTLAEDAHAAEETDHGDPAPAAPAGLALAQDGYRLVQERDALVAGRAQPYVFRILGPGGSTLRDYDVEHERRLHLIVVGRSPNAHFLHLHPTMRRDGTWTVPVTLPANGSYRVFADFTTRGERRTLGVDLAGSDGPTRAAAGISRYDVELRVDGDRLEFAPSLAGKPAQLQRYLGAAGHLVVPRDGDLAYIHAHPDEDELAFDVPFPSEGRYRLYLQFKVGGRVETVSKVVTR